MAFSNKFGHKISYECTELMEELKQDIQEFGGELLLYVITTRSHGVQLYIDYSFYEENFDFSELNLKPGEEVVKMTASAFMELLKIQNEII